MKRSTARTTAVVVAVVTSHGTAQEKEREVVGGGTESDGGDEREQEVPLGGVFLDVVREEENDPAGDDEFREDEQPAPADVGGSGEGGGEVHDHPGDGRALAGPEEVDADGRRDAVERVGEQGDERPAIADDLGPVRPEGERDHGGEEGGTEHAGDRPDEPDRIDDPGGQDDGPGEEADQHYPADDAQCSRAPVVGGG